MKTRKCISCGHEFTGNYCNNCGEKVIHPEDRKLKHFAGEFINAITFADSKFWRTIKYILLKPGTFSRDFVDGKRRAYMKPISLFFLANLIYFLLPLFSTFNNTLQTQTTYGNGFHSALADEMVQDKLLNRNTSFEEYAKEYNAKTSELSKLLLIVMAIMLALIFSIIHYKRDHLLADHVVISLELMTFIILIPIQLQGAIVYALARFDLYTKSESVSEGLISSISLSMLAYFLVKMERNFYQFSKWRKVLNVVLSLVCFVLVLYLYRGFLFFVTFWSV